jgi:threonine dehydrogenase-like Zn-dependent dehydrogenase
MTTQSLWYLGERRVEIREVEIPEPGSQEVLVGLEACGLCKWDIRAYLGKFGSHQPYPFSAGHEGVGRIAKVGSGVRGLQEGQRVALHELPVGRPGGALLARHALRSMHQLAVIPEDGEPAYRWIVEPVACVLNGIGNSGLKPGDKAAVVGTGYMGLLIVQGLRRSLTGKIFATDIAPERLRLAEGFGADECRTPDSLPPELKGSFDLVFETAGTTEALILAQSLLKSGGTAVIFAWHDHLQTFDLDRWHVNSWRFLNLGPEMNPHFGDLYPAAISLMANSTFSNRKLINHTAALESAQELFETAAEGRNGYIKGAVVFK